MNQFYKLWVDGETKKNDYVLWKYTGQVGRDEKWKEETIRNTNYTQFASEFECEFLGSVNTLIKSAKIKATVYQSSKTNGRLSIFEEPKKGPTYLCTVDVK